MECHWLKLQLAVIIKCQSTYLWAFEFPVLYSLILSSNWRFPIHDPVENFSFVMGKIASPGGLLNELMSGFWPWRCAFY